MGWSLENSQVIIVLGALQLHYGEPVSHFRKLVKYTCKNNEGKDTLTLIGNYVQKYNMHVVLIINLLVL